MSDSLIEDVKMPFAKTSRKVKDARSIKPNEKIRIESSKEINNLITLYDNKCSKIGEPTNIIKIINPTTETIVSVKEYRHKNLLIQIEDIPIGVIKQ